MSHRIEIDVEFVIPVLKATRGNISRAARILELSRPKLHRVLKEHRLESMARDLRRGLRH